MRGKRPFREGEPGKGTCRKGRKEASADRSPREGSAMPISGADPRTGSRTLGAPGTPGRPCAPSVPGRQANGRFYARGSALSNGNSGGRRGSPGGRRRAGFVRGAPPRGSAAQPRRPGRDAGTRCRDERRTNPGTKPGGAGPGRRNRKEPDGGRPGGAGRPFRRSGLPGAFPSAAPQPRGVRGGPGEAGAPRPTGTTSSRRGRLPLPRTAGPGWRPAGRPHPPAGRTAGGPGARFPRGPAGP